MLNKRLMAVAAAVLLTSVPLTACGDDSDSGDSANGLKAVDLALSTDSLFAYGYWLADSLGYYEDEGLDVTLQPTGGSSDVAQLLSSNQVPAGMGVPGAMLPAIERGADIHPFFTYAYGEVFDVVVPAGSDISEIADLEGKTIGVTALSGGEAPLLRALLVDAGLDPDSDVEITAIGEATPNIKLSLEQGRVDAFAGPKSATSQFEAVGLETVSIAPESLSELPAEGLVASADSKDDTDLLVALARATAKGQLVAYTNEDGAACLMMEALPEQFSDVEAGRDSLAGVIAITTAPEESGVYRFGDTNPEGWATYVNIYQQAGTLTEDIAVDDYVISDLGDQINDFDQAEIVEEAENLNTDC